MSDLAKLIAEDTQDAPHFNLYGFRTWRNAISLLLEVAEADTVEAVMRSDFPKWAGERQRFYSHIPLSEFLAEYLSNIGWPIVKQIIERK